MKIRIRGNSIRLRLSQQEMDEFAKTGTIRDRIQFGILNGGQLAYTLEKSNIPKLTAQYEDNHIKVLVPNDLAHVWATTELVGLEHIAPTDENGGLKILIEKDFQCLNFRINEDESDSFPNPNAKHHQ